jgi:hypothetical protein
VFLWYSNLQSHDQGVVVDDDGFTGFSFEWGIFFLVALTIEHVCSCMFDACIRQDQRF